MCESIGSEHTAGEAGHDKREADEHLDYIFRIADRIITSAHEEKISIRLMGSTAIWTHCSKFRFLYSLNNRIIKDIDFAGYFRDIVKIRQLFIDLGFKEDLNVMRLYGRRRRIFIFSRSDLHVDMILDRFHFCHDIDFRNRLELDCPTIPLADLLLTKMQIVQVTNEDLLDIVLLFLEHDIRKGHDRSIESIDVEYVSRLCAKDWGLWRTVIGNAQKVKDAASRFLEKKVQIISLESRVDEFIDKVDGAKKSLKWRFRGLLGERKKWFNDVEEVKR